MIAIKKVEDLKQRNIIAETFSIELQAEDKLIATFDGDEILQCAVFCYENECGKIRLLEGFDGNLDYLDGLCRSILNIMDINGVKEIYLPLKYEKIAKKIGFSLKNDAFFLNLEGFFSCGCGCGK